MKPIVCFLCCGEQFHACVHQNIFTAGRRTAGQTCGNFRKGDVLLEGSNTELVANNFTLGGKIPVTSSPDGNWTYSGYAAFMVVSDHAALVVHSGLLLEADALDRLHGGIFVSSGGSIDIGGGGIAPADTLEVGSNGSLLGHGLITGAVTGDVPVSDSTTTPTYSLNIVNSGTIDAEQGTLVLDGNLSGDGQVLVGLDSTLEFGGSAADDATAMFPPDGDPTVRIDAPKTSTGIAANEFNADINSTNYANVGDKIDLPNVPYFEGQSPIDASFLFETGQGQKNYVLQVLDGGNTYRYQLARLIHPNWVNERRM